MTHSSKPDSSGRALLVGLWSAQIVLALLFGFAGATKLFTPISELVKTMPFATNVALVRFIGISELAGALGLLLPALTRIAPWLTPLAAASLTVVMVLAAGYHVALGQFSHALIPLAFGALSWFIAWARTYRAPIYPRRAAAGTFRTAAF
jgi:putative oxidoreductase